MPTMHAPAFVLVVILAALPAHVCADSTEALAAAIEARLRLMPDVARYKWNSDAPVADPVREATLLDSVTARADALGVPAVCARSVIEAQLAASRAWQARLIQRWRNLGRGAFAGVPDLATVQRPAIDAATERLLRALRDVGCTTGDTLAKRIARAPAGVDADVWALAVAPWRAPTR